MKKLTKILASVAMAATVAISAAIPFVSASAAELDTTKKGSISVECAKPGYTFEIFKVASLDNHANTTAHTYDTDYTSLVPAIDNAVNSGDTASIVSTLDAMDTMPSGAVSKGTWETSAASTTHIFSNLDQGIYYIRPVNYPAGVTSITGSAIALPYYDGTQWVYDYSGVNLASKVMNDTPTTVKTITNSTKNNVNYTDVSLGDTVSFNIKSKTAGSSSMKLKSYTVQDNMSSGLTLDKNSFTVQLLKADGTKAADVAKTDYDVNIVSEGDGENTVFNVAFTNTYLQDTAFYGSDVVYTSISYNATLNKNAVVGTAGNPNQDVKLVYSNKNDVTSEVEGNTVYVYTYGINLTKLNEDGGKLEGATFKLYTSEANAKADTGAIATGTSDNQGKTVFKTGGNEIKLQSGTYYVVETEAPTGYNVYGKVIPITINATYGSTFTNNTYVTNAPTDGYATLSVTDTKLVLPQTGGIGNIIFYVIGGIGFIVGGTAFFISRKKAKAENK